jgi:thiamine-phosphate pyrophosphorylase
MRTLSQCKLYAILDTGYCPPGRMGRMLEQMIAGGIDIVQLRAKGMAPDRVLELVGDLHLLSRAASVPFIINDHPSLVGSTGVEGAHIGVEDMPVAEARRLAGRKCLIGKSSHSIDQALDGAGQGADYLGFGPLFATATKPDYLPIGTAVIREVYQKVSVPVFCIGGIKLDNLPMLQQKGAQRFVIVSGILLAPDPSDYCGQCLAVINRRSLPSAAPADGA